MHKKLNFACKIFFSKNVGKFDLRLNKIRFAVEKKTNKFLGQIFKIT